MIGILFWSFFLLLEFIPATDNYTLLHTGNISCSSSFIHQQEFPFSNKDFSSFCNRNIYWATEIRSCDRNVCPAIPFPATGNISCSRNFIHQQEFLLVTDNFFLLQKRFPVAEILYPKQIIFLLQQEVISCDTLSCSVPPFCDRKFV